jgi:hypothetical protein
MAYIHTNKLRGGGGGGGGNPQLDRVELNHSRDGRSMLPRQWLQSRLMQQQQQHGLMKIVSGRVRHGLR